MTRNEREGLLWILIASAGFACMPALVKTVYSHSSFEALDLALWRFIVAVPLIWLLVAGRRRAAARGRQPRPPLFKLLILGVVFAAAVLTAFFALERLPGSTYVVLFYTYPSMVVLLSFFMGEPVQRKALLALTMALLGISLTVPDFAAAGIGDRTGVAFALGNAAVVAVYYLLSKRFLAGVADVFAASAWMMSGTLLVLLLWLPLRGLALPQDAPTLLGLLGVGTIGTVLPIFATNLGIQKIGAAPASLVSTAEPVMSMVISMIFLSEVILPVQWLGAALIVSSVVILQRRRR